MSQVICEQDNHDRLLTWVLPKKVQIIHLSCYVLSSTSVLTVFSEFYKAASVMPVDNSKGKFVISHFLERDIDGVKWCRLTEWSCKRCCYLRCAEPFRPIYVPRNSRSALLLGYPVSSVGTRRLVIQGNIFCLKVLICVVSGETASLIAKLWQD